MFMRPGDHITVSMHDTPHGLQTVLLDLSNGQVGSMTASAANGFGQIQYAPTGTSCTEIPYDFHPMYSTSSPQTRVPWAAHSYNVAFDEEIGHFDYCTAVDANGNCTGQEGAAGDQEPADGDDAACFPATASLLVKVSGCDGTNAPGFDGTSYLKDWPDGNRFLHPTAELFSGPLTGPFNIFNYSQAAFETDTPRIEASDLGGTCNRSTGAGCTLVPPTDDGQPATFYPSYSITSSQRPAAAGGSSEMMCPARPPTTSAGSASTARCTRRHTCAMAGGLGLSRAIGEVRAITGVRLPAAQFVVRPAVPADMEQVAAIFAHYVTTSVATFEEVPPTAADWQRALHRRFGFAQAGRLPGAAASTAGGSILS